MSVGRLDPPAPITAVLDHAVDSLLAGGSGYFTIPAGGYLGCDWLTRKGCYRLTLDVSVQKPLDREAAAEFQAELADKAERQPLAPDA